MIDIALWIGRILLVALLFVFVLVAMRTGINQVKNQNPKSHGWIVSVAKGPRELKGVQIRVSGPVLIGRSPGADIVIGNPYVSGRHARFFLDGGDLVIEDLQSSNGTTVNGERIGVPMRLRKGDSVKIADVEIKVSRK